MMAKETFMKPIELMGVCVSVCILGLAGCGSSDNTASKQQQKTATITFSTVSSAHTDPLLGLQLAAKLPEGVSFKNITTALTGHNDTGQLMGGSYSASTRTVTLVVASPTTPLRFGTFAELKCDVASGVSLDQSSFETINSPFPDVQMDSGNVTATEDLTKKIPVKLTVTFGY